MTEQGYSARAAVAGGRHGGGRRPGPRGACAAIRAAPSVCGGAGRSPLSPGALALLPPAAWPGKALSKPQQHTLRYARSQFSPGAAENPAGGRGGAPGGGGWPSRAGTPGRAAPDGPGAAPCAGVAWTAGALVRVGGRHCAGRETAPARAWRELEVGAWCALSECAPRLEAPSGVCAQGRERRAALSFAAVSPRGVSRCGASSKTRSPHEAVSAAIACMATQR